MPEKTELPGTLKRSPKKAQDTWLKAHDSAVKTYGEGEHAHRVAFAALKNEFEKVDGAWEPKGHKGPSGPHAAHGGVNPKGEDFGGVDYYGNSKDELLERARKLNVAHAATMSKAELARAIAKKID